MNKSIFFLIFSLFGTATHANDESSDTKAFELELQKISQNHLQNLEAVIHTWDRNITEVEQDLSTRHADITILYGKIETIYYNIIANNGRPTKDIYPKLNFQKEDFYTNPDMANIQRYTRLIETTKDNIKILEGNKAYFINQKALATASKDRFLHKLELFSDN